MGVNRFLSARFLSASARQAFSRAHARTRGKPLGVLPRRSAGGHNEPSPEERAAIERRREERRTFDSDASYFEFLIDRAVKTAPSGENASEPT